MIKEKEIIVSSKTENLKKIRKFVSDFAMENGFDSEEISDLILAVDEATTNIIKHAYKFDSTKKIILNISFEDDEIKIIIKDFGEKFDPEKAELPDIKESLRLKRRGGLGIYLMKKLMDKVIYNVENPEYNKIILIKRKRF